MKRACDASSAAVSIHEAAPEPMPCRDTTTGPLPHSRTDTTAPPPTATLRAGKRASSRASSEAGRVCGSNAFGAAMLLMAVLSA